MTSPNVLSSNTDFSGNLSHQFDLPGTIDAGNVIVVIASIDGDPTISNILSGYTLIGRLSNSADDAQLGVFISEATGSEDGSEIALYDVDVDENSNAIIYVIEGFYGDFVDGTDYHLSTGATGNSDAPDSPSATAPWGSADNLAITMYSIDRDNRAVDSYPSGYSNGLTQKSGGSIGTSVGAATKAFSGATEDPGAFTLENSGQWVAATLLLRGTGTAAATEVAGADTVTVSDSGAATFEVFVAGADTVSVADSSDRLLTIEIAGADTTTAADTAAAMLTIQVAGADTVTASDQASTSPAIEVSGSDTVTISDTASRLLVLEALGADTVTVADNAIRLLTRELDAVDIVTVSDTAGRLLTRELEGSDTVTLTDAASLSETVDVGGTDTVTVTVTAALDEGVLAKRTIQATATVSGDIAMTASVSTDVAITSIVSADIAMTATLEA